MRLTTKGRFAVTAMLDIALREALGPVTLSGISARQKISLSYLEQLLGKLRRRALVISVKGPGGGYSLARPAQAISVADIIVAVDEPLDTTQCGGKENCLDDTTRCMTHDLWVSLNKTIFQYLASISLQTLTEQQRNPMHIIYDQRQQSAVQSDTVASHDAVGCNYPQHKEDALNSRENI